MSFLNNCADNCGVRGFYSHNIFTQNCAFISFHAGWAPSRPKAICQVTVFSTKRFLKFRSQATRGKDYDLASKWKRIHFLISCFDESISRDLLNDAELKLQSLIWPLVWQCVEEGTGEHRYLPSLISMIMNN